MKAQNEGGRMLQETQSVFGKAPMRAEMYLAGTGSSNAASGSGNIGKYKT